MNRKFSKPFWLSMIFALTILITPQAFAAEFVIDDFSGGTFVEVIDSTGTCEYDTRVSAIPGGVRGIFACRDSGSGQSTGQVEPFSATLPPEFLFRLNGAGGAAGLVYDVNGALLGGVDITDGGNNNGIFLEIFSSDSQVTGFIHASDTSGNFGIHQFIIPATASPTTVSIPLLLVTDTNSAGPVNFASLDFLGVSFEGEQLAASVSDFILRKISTDVLPDSADLIISKSDSPDPVVAGNILTYTVRVSNAGPSDAQNVVVTDTLPAGVTFLSTTGCAEDPNADPACSLGTIASGAFVEYTISVSVDSNTIGVIQNTASVASSTALINIGDDSATENTTVILEEICNDGIDNDGDGLIDGADPDCAIPNRTLLVTVLNESGQPVSDANCTVSDPGFGILKSGFTDSNGEFMADFMINDGTQVEISCSKDGSAGTESLFIDGSSSFAIELELSFSQVIGGEIIQIETTSLLLAGSNSFSWMIPVVLSVLGIGLFVIKRKNQ